MALELDVVYGVDSLQDDRWNDRDYNKTSSWNGKMIQQLATDQSMQSVYQDAKFTAANNLARVYQVNHYSSNDDSYNSFNDPSSANSRDDNSNSGETDTSGNNDPTNRLHYKVDGYKNPDGSSKGTLGFGYGRENSNNDGTRSKTELEADLSVDDKGKVSGGVVFKQEWEF